MGKFWQQARYQVVDSEFVGKGSATDVAKAADLPDLNWEATLARAIAEGVLEEWVKTHPGVELPDVI